MLRCARKQHAQWERRLAQFGLANYQLKNASIQQLGTNNDSAFPAHDPDMRGPWYNQPGVRQKYTYADLSGFGLVPAHRNMRKVPEWALADQKISIVLLHLYPRLLVKRNQKDARDVRAGQGLRQMAAIMALVIYRAYRQLLSDKVIAEELGVSRHAVSNRLDKLNRTAKKLFGKQKGVTARASRDAGGKATLEKDVELLLTKDAGVSALLGTNRGDDTNGMFANVTVKQPTYSYIGQQRFIHYRGVS